MRRGWSLALYLVMALAPLAYARQPASKQRQGDVEKTASGELKIVPVTHGSVMLEWSARVIHVDPWSQKIIHGWLGAQPELAA